MPSTFMTVGELRGLIHEQLALPDGETVLLYPDEDLSYETRYPDVKQFPRGSRFRATRTTVEQLAKEDEQRAGQAEGSKKEDESQKPDAGEDSNADSEESEFGPDPWDREAADKWKEKEKRAVKPKREAANDQVTNMAEGKDSRGAYCGMFTVNCRGGLSTVQLTRNLHLHAEMSQNYCRSVLVILECTINLSVSLSNLLVCSDHSSPIQACCSHCNSRQSGAASFNLSASKS